MKGSLLLVSKRAAWCLFMVMLFALPASAQQVKDSKVRTVMVPKPAQKEKKKKKHHRLFGCRKKTKQAKHHMVSSNPSDDEKKLKEIKDKKTREKMKK